MAEVKWIKIVTDIFDDEKILLIESLPDKYAIIVCWFKLLCLAGKQNNNGVFMMNQRIAYTDEMIATIFRMPTNTVRMALNTFQEFGMIEMIDGVITIPNWDKHQSLDAYEKKKAYDRQYRMAQREKQRLLAAGVNDNRTDSRTTVVVPDKIRLEEDVEEEGDIKGMPSVTLGYPNKPPVTPGYQPYPLEVGQPVVNQRLTEVRPGKVSLGESSEREVIVDAPDRDVGPKTTRKRFVPPTVEEVRAYCRERQNGVDPQRFVDYYTANGWRVGKNPMKDWKAAVRTWERKEQGGKRLETKPCNPFLDMARGG